MAMPCAEARNNLTRAQGILARELHNSNAQKRKHNFNSKKTSKQACLALTRRGCPQLECVRGSARRRCQKRADDGMNSWTVLCHLI